MIASTRRATSSPLGTRTAGRRCSAPPSCGGARRIALEDHAERAILRAAAGDVVPVAQQSPRGRRLETGEYHQEGGLSRSRTAPAAIRNSPGAMSSVMAFSAVKWPKDFPDSDRLYPDRLVVTFDTRSLRPAECNLGVCSPQMKNFSV